jgi:hypothetical protein
MNWSAAAALGLTLVFTVAPAFPAYAQGCDPCSRPRILVYGTDVRVPRPDGAEAVQSWWKLFAVHGFATSGLAEDPTRDCLRLYTAAVSGGRLRVGAEHSDPVPAGPVTTADYLMYGIGEDGGDKWVYTLVIEAAEAREEVVRVSRRFTKVVGETDHGEAGRGAVASIIPLFNTIREWETGKRNTRSDVAMRDIIDGVEQIRLRPEKTRLETGESTVVEVEMIDCDGEPLAGRTVTFGDAMIGGSIAPGTTGGRVVPLDVTLNADGRAKVTFTAGSTPGLANLISYHVHEKPCGRHGAFSAQVPITVRRAPPDLWIVEGVINTHATTAADTSSTSSLGGIPTEMERRSNSLEYGSAHVKVITVAEVGDDGSVYLSSDSFGSVFEWGNGDRSEWLHTSNMEWTHGRLTSGDIRTDTRTARGAGPVLVEVAFGPDQRSIHISLRMDGSYLYHGQQYPGTGTSDWQPYGGDHETKDVVQVGCDGNDVVLTRVGSGFAAKCMLTKQSKYPEGIWGTVSGSWISTLQVTISPYHTSTR